LFQAHDEPIDKEALKTRKKTRPAQNRLRHNFLSVKRANHLTL
jgi:hypothetical protein